MCQVCLRHTLTVPPKTATHRQSAYHSSSPVQPLLCPAQQCTRKVLQAWQRRQQAPHQTAHGSLPAPMLHPCAHSDDAAVVPQAWQRCQQPPALRTCRERCMPTASRRRRTSLLPRSSGRTPRWVLVIKSWGPWPCHLMGSMLLSLMRQPLLLPNGRSSNVGLAMAWGVRGLVLSPEGRRSCRHLWQPMPMGSRDDLGCPCRWCCSFPAAPNGAAPNGLQWPCCLPGSLTAFM